MIYEAGGAIFYSPEQNGPAVFVGVPSTSKGGIGLRVDELPEISDEQMKERLGQSRDYTLIILHTTATTFTNDSRPIIWEHGRRNMALRAAGALSIVCPATDESDVAGIGIFGASPDQVREIIEDDPAVQAGVLTYELHPIRGFPGDSLPE
jgi:hypothetical protein